MSEFQPLWQPAGETFEALDLGLPPDHGFQTLEAWVGRDVPTDAPPTPKSAAPEPHISDDDSLDGLDSDSLGSGEFAAADEPDSGDSGETDVALLKVREEAYAAGHAEGLEAGKAELAARVARVDDLVKQLEGVRSELFERSIVDLADTAMHIGRAIVGRELAVDSSGVEGLIRTVLTDLHGADEVIIRVANEDARTMREAYPALMDLVGRDGELQLEIDPSLRPGGAIVETRGGTVDASVESQFEAFAQGIADWADRQVEAIDD